MLLGAYATDASALALGRITVQSALGEPLSAQIDIPEINADEVASLRAVVASPDAFKAAGLDYNAALSDVKITLEKRADGSYFLRLKSSRPVNEPFMDLILESSWASGRVVRDYTMLFDPPALRQNQQPITAQAAPAPSPATQSQKPAARTPSTSTPTSRAPTTAAAPMPAGEGKQVTVKSGDTAGRIASANKPPAVSLDQMLVAMLRANPDAFVGGNVNRLRSGAVLGMPSQEQAALIPPEDARQTLVAQSRDFNEFRRRLAETVPSTKIAAAERQSSGKITAQVEEKKPSAASPDKLTLSKAAAQGKASATEDKIAKQRAAQDTATRVAELNKNISDLNKLGKPSATAAPTAPAAAPSTAKPGIPVPIGAPANVGKPASAPAAAPAPAPMATAAPVVAAASAPAAATSPSTMAASAVAPTASATLASASSATPNSSAPVATAAKPASKPAAKAAKAAPPPETSFLDDLLDNPLILAGIGLVVALGAGFGFYRIQQRKKTAQVDSSFLESRLQPDSFFGASGGQRIDTNEGGATGSSMVYSPSQLDAAGDVDPVAEADVYLAYGRDLQAEEILKEALRTQPQRVAIHTKLLEIYAKRRDAKAFELVATEAYGLTHGDGPEWERICELGQELDPSNSLYRPGGQPSDGAAAAAASAVTSSGKFGQTMQTQAIAAPEPAAANPDLDLDLDFSLDDPAAAAPVAEPVASPVAAASPGSYERTQAVDAGAAPPMPAIDLDFGTPAPAPAPAATLDAPDLVLDENSLNSGLNLDATLPAGAMSAPAASVAAPAPAPASKDGMLEFDLGGLSLDLPSSKAAPAPAPAVVQASGPDTESPTTAGSPLSTAGFEDSSSDPLATKLALAQEFNAIGDPDGARSLAQEVIAEASGDLKTKAQKFLAEIS
jgi:pilus assembly protein FimV